MKRKALILIVLAFATAVQVFSQSNTMLDSILSSRNLTVSQLAYLALSSSGKGELEDPQEATDALGTLVPWFKGRSPDSLVNLGEYCHAMLQAHRVPVGIWYSIFPGPRYAVREFVYLGFIKNPVWPSKAISGEQAVRTLGNIIDWKEGAK